MWLWSIWNDQKYCKNPVTKTGTHTQVPIQLFSGPRANCRRNRNRRRERPFFFDAHNIMYITGNAHQTEAYQQGEDSSGDYTGIFCEPKENA